MYFGAINRNADGSQGSYVKFMAVTRRGSLIVHENYNDNSLAFDIALLELPEDAPIDHPHVGILVLPSVADRTRTFANVIGTASGFGELST